MRQILLSTLAAATLAGCAAMPHDSAGTQAASRENKMAFDVTTGNPQALALQLITIDLTRKQLIEAGITPRIVVTFRGDASYYTQTNLGMVKEADRADALAIAARIRDLRKASGVDSIEQCNVPLASRKLKPADIMPEVTLVPNGWIALVNYQHQGYAYISP